MCEELKPCPFCGQQDAFVEQLDSDASVVICQGMIDEHSACLARGPVGVQQSEMEDQPGRDAAIAEWNRRAQPAEAEGVELVPFWVLFDATTPEPLIKKHMPEGVLAFFDSEEDARRAKALHPGTDYKRAPYVRAATLSAVTAERDGLAAARMAYANEFAPDENGDPDVGNVHANIRALKAERDRLKEEMGILWKKLDKFDSQSHGITALAENERLGTEVEALRKDAERWNYVRIQGDDMHWLNLLRVDLDDFGGNINAAVDALIDGEAPAMAAKEA